MCVLWGEKCAIESSDLFGSKKKSYGKLMSVLHRLPTTKNLFGQSSFPPGMASVLCQTVMKVFVYFAMNNGLNDSSRLVESMKIAQ